MRKNLPPEFKNSTLVALHGSWNRTEKIGYKVVSLHFEPNGAITERDFVAGFEQKGIHARAGLDGQGNSRQHLEVKLLIGFLPNLNHVHEGFFSR